MTNIKYSKRFKLRNGERIDFCPECATNRVFKIIPTIEGDKE